MQKRIFSHVINLGVSKWSPRLNYVMRYLQVSIYPAKACCNHWTCLIVFFGVFLFVFFIPICLLEGFSPIYLKVSLRFIYCQKFFWGSQRFWQVTFILLLFETGEVQALCKHDQRALCQRESRWHRMVMRILDHAPGYHEPSPVIMTEGADHQADSCPGLRVPENQFLCSFEAHRFCSIQMRR